MRDATVTIQRPKTAPTPLMRPPAPPESPPSGVAADAWDKITRLVSHVAETVRPPLLSKCLPHKIKEVPQAAFERFQNLLVANGIAALPYCPRQYFNEQGERYVLSRACAFGTFGRVHIGIRSADGRPVAVKEIPIKGRWHASLGDKQPNPHRHRDAYGKDLGPEKIAAPLDQIEREISLAIKAGECPIDGFIYRGRSFIVSDLMSGDTFEAVLAVKKHGQPYHRKDLAIMLLKSVAYQMARVHALGVVHRDLKLENILFSPLGALRVTDFGWATELAPNASMVGTRVGTMGAVPLEALRGQTTDHRFDVFSLGTAVCTAALGHRAFDAPQGISARKHLIGFERWLDYLRDSNGDIDMHKLAHPWNDLDPALDHWVNTTYALISVLGERIALFMLNHMLTGSLEKRASMSEVVAFCDSCSDIDQGMETRAAEVYMCIAMMDAERGAMMQGMYLFDEFFPSSPTQGIP